MSRDKQQFDPTCDPVEVVDQKTGLKKVLYLCAQPFQKRVDHYKENTLHLWTDIGLVATIIILLATLVTLWVFNTLQHTNLVDFQVTYNTEELVNGQRISFDVHYTNTSKKKAITGAEVIVRFPDGLVDVSIADTRYNQTTHTISFGSLQPQESGSFSVQGLLLSDIGSPEKFVFVLNYFNDLGQAQQEFTSREFIVEQSIVEISLTVPEKIFIGSDITSVVTITNNEDYSQDALSIELIYPRGYSSTDGTSITLPSLSPQETLTKEITGSLSDLSPGTHPFSVILYTMYDGRLYVLNKASVSSLLAFSKLRPSFIETTNNTAIKPGEQSVITLAIENNENFTARNINITYVVDGEFVDIPFLQRMYGASVQGNTITFNNVTTLEQGQTHTHTFTVAALPSLRSVESPDAQQNITVRARVSFNADQEEKTLTVSTQPLNIPLTGSLGLQSFGVFFSSTGDQLGVGSLPPRPGEYTAYWGIIRVTNGVNKLRNVTVRADIPAHVEFTDLYNITYGAPVRFLSDNSQLEWYLGDVPAYAGIVTVAPEARIQLAIVPSANDVGKALPLLSNVRISGIDERTGETITASGSIISTAIFKEDYLNKVNP